VTPRHGSRVVLGEILTDLELEPDRPLEIECGSCSRCIDACPTGALRTPYFVDRNLCIQAHCGRRAVVPQAVRLAWGNRFYGCTDCQDACPHSERAATTSRTVARGHVGAAVALKDMLLIGQEEFSRRFADNQIGMRERNVIRRNAIIAAGNSRSRLFDEDLSACARDDDPIVRQCALWAIWRIHGKAARSVLSEALGREPQAEVAAEIKSLLDGIAAVE
jgi:epoxyqueuosine reductase